MRFFTSFMLCASAIALVACSSAPEQTVVKPTLQEVGIFSAGAGSAFLPYAQGAATYLTAQGLKTTALESKGSVENMQKVQADPKVLGTVFLGTAFEGVNASAPWTEGKKFDNVRALTPMYETSFQLVALKSSGITNLSGIRGKRVGVGPAKGPAENFFVGLMEALGMQATIVNGTPAALAADLKAGKIDVLWQGAPPPIPAIKEVADTADAVVFGMNDAEQQAMKTKFPFLALATVPTATYKGQTQAIKSVAAWNFLIAHKDFPAADAYWITRTLLSSTDPKAQIHSSTGPTTAGNAPSNTVVPFHPGALRYYQERGIAGVK
ncbi:MAG: TAXI family TRAP transporter solute-binding subunit [Burkholderiaceae bacterium]